ncbi:fibroblast growth factor-binding protein 1 [Pelodytes ibericus]
MRLKCIVLTVLAVLVSQMFLVEGNNQREGRKAKEEAAKGRQRGEGKDGKQAGASPDNKGSRSKGGKGSLGGKFVSKEKADCVWSVTGTESVVLNVQCSKEETRFSCSFGGNPSSCPKFAENQKSYWKQITRALRKQKNICQDPKAVLKSKECKKGPQEAHLSYIISTLIIVEEKGDRHIDSKPTIQISVVEPNEDCADDTDVAGKQAMAEEYCGSWGSMCNFFLSMLQSRSC